MAVNMHDQHEKQQISTACNNSSRLHHTVSGDSYIMQHQQQAQVNQHTTQQGNCTSVAIKNPLKHSFIVSQVYCTAVTSVVQTEICLCIMLQALMRKQQYTPRKSRS